VISYSLALIACWMLAGGAASLLLLSLLNNQLRYRWRTVDDVGDFMRKPDDELLASMLVPTEKVEVRGLMARLILIDDRRARRAEIERIREQFQRKHHNARVCKEWGDTEWLGALWRRHDYDDHVYQNIRTLWKSANHAWFVLSLALIKIWFFCLLHFLQLDRLKFLLRPEPAALGKVWGVSVMTTYSQLKEAVNRMGALHPEGVCSAIAELM
jgi:hypothetical protein